MDSDGKYTRTHRQSCYGIRDISPWRHMLITAPYQNNIITWATPRLSLWRETFAPRFVPFLIFCKIVMLREKRVESKATLFRILFPKFPFLYAIIPFFSFNRILKLSSFVNRKTRKFSHRGQIVGLSPPLYMLTGRILILVGQLIGCRTYRLNINLYEAVAWLALAWARGAQRSFGHGSRKVQRCKLE